MGIAIIGGVVTFLDAYVFDNISKTSLVFSNQLLPVR